jgi:hypothetical protein
MRYVWATVILIAYFVIGGGIMAAVFAPLMLSGGDLIWLIPPCALIFAGMVWLVGSEL